jgi:hypothetical protein
MDWKDQRIAELEAEVRRLNALLEEPGPLVCRKVKVPRSRPHDVEDAIRRARKEHLAEFTGGLRALGAVVGVGLLAALGFYLVDQLNTEAARTAPPLEPPVASDR